MSADVVRPRLTSTPTRGVTQRSGGGGGGHRPGAVGGRLAMGTIMIQPATARESLRCLCSRNLKEDSLWTDKVQENG